MKEERELRVGEVANLVGISVRTLHHYDAIDLLIPEEITEAGYRVYSDKNLETLQQILFFRELGFSLKKIKEVIDQPSFDHIEALYLHRDMIQEEIKRLNKVLKTIDKTIKHKQGEIQMTRKEKFSGFNFSENPYEEEARKRYGDKAIDQSQMKVSRLSKDKKGTFKAEFNAVYQDLANIRHEPPASEIAQEAIEVWYKMLNQIGDYSPEAFKGLGKMYVEDQRFSKNIDQFGNGLALFMSEAMAIYADNH